MIDLDKLKAALAIAEQRNMAERAFDELNRQYDGGPPIPAQINRLGIVVGSTGMVLEPGLAGTMSLATRGILQTLLASLMDDMERALALRDLALDILPEVDEPDVEDLI